MSATPKQKRMIKEVWNGLEYELSNIDWTSYGKQLLEMTMIESKAHDRFRHGDIKRGISVVEEAKYFAIKRIIESLIEGYKPEPSDYMSIQKSCFAAYAIATNERFSKSISRWSEKHLEAAKEIASWDYCDLIRDYDNRKDLRINGERISR